MPAIITSRYAFDSINHLHTLDGRPLTGVSSVGSVIAKPLTWWAVGEGLKLFGWTPIFEKDGDGKRVKADRKQRLGAASKWISTEGTALLIGDNYAQDWLDKLDEAYYAHSKTKDKAAVTGTDRHALLSDYINECLRYGETLTPISPDSSVRCFYEWATDNVKRFLWTEAHCYSERYWVGGICDCGALMNDDTIAVIDFKSSKDAYPDQFWQAAGYDLLITENGGYTSDGQKLFDPPKNKIERHVIFPFGAPKPEARVRYDVADNREAFLAALTIHRKLGNYE